MSFEGQTVVVTGGTRGLGRAVTLGFLEAGATVYATYHSGEEAANALADQCAAWPGRLRLARFDVADHGAAESFWSDVEQEVSDGVDVLVNNSGIRRDALLALMSPTDWSQVIETNLTGGYTMSKFAVRHMMTRRYGRIVFITSPAGRLGFEGQGNYAASKAGQVGLMRSLAKEVAKRGITANCVSPGFVETELLADLSQTQLTEYRKQVPARRFGTPEEIAFAVRCVAAREAGYINGAVLEVNGGL
ncbi:MAG: 3-oxoacyl-ACP reductase FabG [Planctomycetota bacterium]|jgi:3-oxoacyl-[acyl-carrier protein] reductase|nr:3-oxoacyl-ACP reductase FabG [Planctomycetota bacterium]MDP6764124.1 3-oxoacyl-ACP reductase FabG [Planctomycetota bacterium]MDP6989587.1 3-oxoacyl-ACP reductase FabG [Planctomycetota bacterium]